mmetsp:Transcript_9701/g.33518  ORF Transcript_9701/g.33518 Transcript_9701/m.33518 type:complete len:215 (+) Transcript_9701:1183-1827(+)
MGGSSSLSRSFPSIPTQIRPLVWFTMKATSSSVIFSAAMIRSPSFSLSSSSSTTTNFPFAMSWMASWMESNPGVGLKSWLSSCSWKLSETFEETSSSSEARHLGAAPSLREPARPLAPASTLARPARRPAQVLAHPARKAALLPREAVPPSAAMFFSSQVKRQAPPPRVRAFLFPPPLSPLPTDKTLRLLPLPRSGLADLPRPSPSSPQLIEGD